MATSVIHTRDAQGGR